MTKLKNRPRNSNEISLWEFAFENPVRVEIVKIMLNEDCVKTTSIAQNIPPKKRGTLPTHLAILERAGITERVREGRDSVHAIRVDVLEKVIQELIPT